MKKYKVKIEVVQSTIEYIEANSKEEAKELAWDMIDNNELFIEPDYADYKVTVKESINKNSNSKKPIKESIIDDARYFLSKDYNDEEVWKELDEEGCDDEYIQNVIKKMNELFEEEPEDEFGSPYGHIW